MRSLRHLAGRLLAGDGEAGSPDRLPGLQRGQEGKAPKMALTWAATSARSRSSPAGLVGGHLGPDRLGGRRDQGVEGGLDLGDGPSQAGFHADEDAPVMGGPR